jgi:hypothetical protein
MSYHRKFYEENYKEVCRNGIYGHLVGEAGDWCILYQPHNARSFVVIFDGRPPFVCGTEEEARRHARHINYDRKHL